MTADRELLGCAVLLGVLSGCVGPNPNYGGDAHIHILCRVSGAECRDQTEPIDPMTCKVGAPTCTSISSPPPQTVEFSACIVEGQDALTFCTVKAEKTGIIKDGRVVTVVSQTPSDFRCRAAAANKPFIVRCRYQGQYCQTLATPPPSCPDAKACSKLAHTSNDILECVPSHIRPVDACRSNCDNGAAGIPGFKCQTSVVGMETSGVACPGAGKQYNIQATSSAANITVVDPPISQTVGINSGTMMLDPGALAPTQLTSLSLSLGTVVIGGFQLDQVILTNTNAVTLVPFQSNSSSVPAGSLFRAEYLFNGLPTTSQLVTEQPLTITRIGPQVAFSGLLEFLAVNNISDDPTLTLVDVNADISFNGTEATASCQPSYAEVEGLQACSSNCNWGQNVYQTAASLTVTPSVAGNYLILTTALYDNTNTNTAFSRQTVVRTTIDDLAYNVSRDQPNSAGTDWMQFASHQFELLPAGTSHTVKVEYATTSTLETATIQKARILAVPVSNGFSNAQALNARLDTYSSTFVNATTVTFTPAVTEDYLIIGTGEVSHSDSTTEAVARLAMATGAGTDVDQGEMRYRPVFLTDPGSLYRSYATARVVNFPAGTQQALKLQIRTTGGGTWRATMRNGRVTAIPLSAIKRSGLAANYAESEAIQFTSSTSLQTAVTTTTGATGAGGYLSMGLGMIRNESLSADVVARLESDSVDTGEEVFRPAKTSNYVPLFEFRKLDWTSGNHTTAVRYRTSVAGTSTEAFVKNARVLAIPMSTNTSGCP